MAKKVRAMLKVQAPAGAATAAPPVGPALGQHGINIMEFIKAFNERTASQSGYVVPAFSLPGSLAAEARPRACLMSTAAGGLLVMNSNERSL